MGYRTNKYIKMDLPKGFVRIDKKTIQSRMTPLLKDLMEIANKEGIKVYLVFGNLIGYERHNKKFVPGDDDIDVAVSYGDRDKLARAIEKHHNLKNGYFGTRTTRSGPGLTLYSEDYEVVSSSFYETGNLTKYSLDIFELANFKNKRDHLKIKRALGYLFMKKSTGGGLQKLVRFLMFPIPKSLLVSLLHKREKRLIKKDGDYEGILIDDVKKSGRTTFKNSNRKGKFEGIEVYLPKESNIFLEARYGDGKTIPNKKSIDGNTHYFGERKRR